jgi:cytoskeletal protein CcmA (bactofilin family)
MFNKPSVFGRNEPVTRRDAVPVLASSATNGERSATAPRAAAASPAAPVAPAVVPAPAARPETTTAAREASLGDNVTGARLIVGPDVKLKGAEILDCDTLVVEGRVEATMDSRVIRIAENGSFSGKVSIDIAEIHGSFEGELTARSQLIIHATGKVHGKIRYGKLVIDEGGELCGDINALSAEKTTAFQLRDEPVKALTAVAG